MRAVSWHSCVRKASWEGGVVTGGHRPPGIAALAPALGRGACLPTAGRPTARWAAQSGGDVRRYRGLAIGSWLTQSALRQRRHQPSQRPSQPSALHPTGGCAKERRDPQHAGLATAAPALDAGGGCRGSAHLGSAHGAGWPLGAHDHTGALWLVGRHALRRGADWGVPLPHHRLEGTRGGPPCACPSVGGRSARPPAR
jgi:hypothetical protein